MHRLAFIFFAMFLSCAYAQSYIVTSKGVVVSNSNCYSFQAPTKWKLVPGNPTPLLFNFSPKTKKSTLQNLPRGAASLSVASGKDSGENPESIEHWMKLRNRAHSFSSVQEIPLPSETGITRAMKVLWTDQEELEPGDPITQTIAVFFDFQRQPFVIYLDFYLDDPRKEDYIKSLITLLESFRPLAKGSSDSCSRSPF
jgi:hypothetical protein